MPWDDAERQRLRKLWNDTANGWSVREIAARMPGRTSRAVNEVASRLDLPRREGAFLMQLIGARRRRRGRPNIALRDEP